MLYQEYTVTRRLHSSGEAMLRYLEKGTPARRGSVAKPSTVSSSFANLISVFLGAAGSPEPKRKRSFDAGAVGLGIVAAMSLGAGLTEAAEPIAIGAAARRGAREEAELSESYTCVISHVAGAGGVRKRVYFGFGSGGAAGGRGWPGEPAPAPAADFLSRCCLCDKRLDGLDIYMYRGEKAFCSAECRCHQMVMDEHSDECRSEALKAYDHSLSSLRSTALPLSESIAAA